jgi:hypothetical protein
MSKAIKVNNVKVEWPEDELWLYAVVVYPEADTSANMDCGSMMAGLYRTRKGAELRVEEEIKRYVDAINDRDEDGEEHIMTSILKTRNVWTCEGMKFCIHQMKVTEQ